MSPAELSKRMKSLFHPSIEGAQHGAKILEEFLKFANGSGARGAQPSNYLLHQKDGTFRTAHEIKTLFTERCLRLDGVSAHCPFWVHTTAWTGSPTIRPFLPPDVAKRSVKEIELWAEDYIMRMLDLCAELGVKIVPMFWGVAFGWEMATGYPWGFWSNGKSGATGSYDLLKEGQERFVKKTQQIREHALKLGIYLCHEIHPGTAAMCADDFNMLVDICSKDSCLGVNADPSHNWEGEDWETRLNKVASRVFAAHIKNHTIKPGMPLRSMGADFRNRAVQFVDLPTGEINMARYAEALIRIGYPARYCKITSSETAPLVVEAESAFRDLDATSANGIVYVRDNLCFPIAAGSFEEGMGA